MTTCFWVFYVICLATDQLEENGINRERLQGFQNKQTRGNGKESVFNPFAFQKVDQSSHVCEAVGEQDCFNFLSILWNKILRLSDPNSFCLGCIRRCKTLHILGGRFRVSGMCLLKKYTQCRQIFLPNFFLVL